MIQVKVDGFLCHYCNREFVREAAYLKHHCKLMDRETQLQTVLGQAALSFYGEWFRQQKKIVPNTKTFQTSKYYNAFIKFTTFSQDVHLADTSIFIKMMIDRDIPPCMWTHDGAYASYLEYLEKKLPPMEQVKLSIRTMLKLSDRAECDISQLFEHLSPNELMQLIRERKLTPWLLLHSHTFGTVFRKISPEQRKLIEELIRPPYWSYKFRQDPAITAKIKNFVIELNI